MFSSGDTAVATSGAGNVTLLAATGHVVRHAVVINEGAAPGFVSFDGGANWCRVPAGPSSRYWSDLCMTAPTILLKRDGGTDMTGVYAEVW